MDNINRSLTKPLFNADVEDIDILLPRFKNRLMEQDIKSRIFVVEQILLLLRKDTKSDKGLVLTRLMKFSIISSLCDVLQTSIGPLLTIVLECLLLASNYQQFYDNHTASDVIDSILKLACLKINCEGEQSCLERLMQSVTDILLRAVKFGVELDTVRVPQQTFHFLKKLGPQNLSSYKLKFRANDLLCGILKHVSLNEFEDSGIIFDICHEVLNSMQDTIRYSDDVNCVSLAVVALCNTCDCSIGFSEVNSDEDVDADDPSAPQEKKKALIKSVYCTMTKIIIPYVKNADIKNETDSVSFNSHLVSCLNKLYHLKRCNDNDLSNHLTANGYLTYFLRVIAESSHSLQRSTCMLLTQILITLAKQSLSTETWHGSSAGFSNILFHGLLSLPETTKLCFDLTDLEEDSTTALLVLAYYHYLGTKNANIISLNSLAAKIMGHAEGQPLPTPILKPLWFLFAVSSLHSLTMVKNNYSLAVKRLSSILESSETSDCYTHHIDLMHYCLRTPEIPSNLRCKIMDFWLIESDGDIKPLLDLDCDKIVRHCLLVIVQTGYSESVVSLAVKGIRELMRFDDAKAIADIVWETLPKVLSSFKPSKINHVKAVLELACISQPCDIPPSITTSCADHIVDIILAKQTDSNFKKMAVDLAHILLVASIEHKYFKVLKLYISAPNLLEDLRIHGFCEENSELSAVCLNLLSYIIRYHRGTTIERKSVLEIDIKDLCRLLILRKKSPCGLPYILRLIHELLTQEIKGSPITLKKIRNDTDEIRVVVNLYEILHIIHWKCNPVQRSLVYQCLLDVLNFCHVHLETLMYHLCTLMSNYDLLMAVISTHTSPCNFYDFVTTWLRYRKKYADDEGQWNSESLSKSPFDEVLDALNVYVDTLSGNKQDGAYYKLKYALALFDERQCIDIQKHPIDMEN